MKKIYLVMTLVIMTMVSCVPEAEKASVETIEVKEVTSNSAKVVCNVSEDGGAEVTSRGVCWSLDENPVIETASSMEAGSGIGNYECEIKGLNSNTTYYVRAYATNSAGVSYGEGIGFITSDGGGDDNGGDDNGGGDDDGDNNFDNDGQHNGHGYVDLGLPSGLKWATCNVGATSPEDYGDYFAWGETNPKVEYTYENSVTNGEQMSDISGNVQYDAATANWGGSWRMPTVEEVEELVVHCEWEWTQVNSVYGSKVIGPNGSCIFLPAEGYRYGSSIDSDGNCGYYWSSTPYDKDLDYYDNYAYCLYFNKGNERKSHGYRFSGTSVRPVIE